MTNIEKAQEFHGHICPGLASGTRVAEVVLRELGHSDDEEIYCIVESTSCDVDALQALVGCTLGKGNLEIRDFGKKVYTFIREDGKALRVALRYDNMRPPAEFVELGKKVRNEEASEDEESRYAEFRKERVREILNRPEDELFDIKRFETGPARKAEVGPSLKCDSCGEGVMMMKAGVFKDRIVCMPCFKFEKKVDK